MVFSWPVFAQKGKRLGCHVCVIYQPKSIKVHSCAMVSDRTFISGLNTLGGACRQYRSVRAARLRVVYRPRWLSSWTVPVTKHGAAAVRSLYNKLYSCQAQSVNQRGLPVWVGGSDGESDGRYICERTTSCTRTAGNALKLMDDTERARALARMYIHTYMCTMSVRASLIDLGIVAVYIYI